MLDLKVPLNRSNFKGKYQLFNISKRVKMPIYGYIRVSSNKKLWNINAIRIRIVKNRQISSIIGVFRLSFLFKYDIMHRKEVGFISEEWQHGNKKSDHGMLNTGVPLAPPRCSRVLQHTAVAHCCSTYSRHFLGIKKSNKNNVLSDKWRE